MKKFKVINKKTKDEHIVVVDNEEILKNILDKGFIYKFIEDVKGSKNEWNYWNSSGEKKVIRILEGRLWHNKRIK